MDCPYCARPMEEGHIASRNDPLAWVPEEAKLSRPPLFPFVRGKSEWIGDIDGTLAFGHFCRSCGKIIISVK